MANTWQSPVAGEPSSGTLHFLATPVLILNRGAATTFTDVDCSASVPAGAKAILFHARCQAICGTGTSYNCLHMRKNGSAVTGDGWRYLEIYITPAINGTIMEVAGEATVECDAGRIIEYFNNTGGATDAISTLNIVGYYA